MIGGVKEIPIFTIWMNGWLELNKGLARVAAEGERGSLLCYQVKWAESV